ncbi:hypothetical protein EYB53_015820 [Candidatus Chloroploca sp. M-50]|uniref:Uncharacterized protein n=1 Tax=Candidatus Chloroploca mongolica TaxID=2528176 RepID=A0ABS4DCK1_9CHLR|nr:hypothetical protein [Candidatus Chloroploca mongolica]MBP1467182.1 hypothetical protein [Candidatus Chloroploca mongolica]
MSVPVTTSSSGPSTTVIKGELHCALTGKSIGPEHAYWAPPLITTRQLITTFVQTLFTNPGALGEVLLGELPNVPYDPAVRQELGNRRTAEQLKLLVFLLMIAAVLIVPMMLIVW